MSVMWSIVVVSTDLDHFEALNSILDGAATTEFETPDYDHLGFETENEASVRVANQNPVEIRYTDDGTNLGISLSPVPLPDREYSAVSGRLTTSTPLREESVRDELLELFRGVAAELEPALLYLDILERSDPLKPSHVQEGPETVGAITYFGPECVENADVNLSEVPAHETERIGDGVLVVPAADYIYEFGEAKRTEIEAFPRGES